MLPSVIGSLDALLARQSAVAAAVALGPCVLFAADRAPGAVAYALAAREPEGADRTAEDLLALRPGRLAHKNSLQVRAVAGLRSPRTLLTCHDR